MSAAWLLAGWLLAGNLLLDDTTFDLGYGPFLVYDSPDLRARPELVNGTLRLPGPGAGPEAGCWLYLPCSPPLAPGPHTVAFRGRADRPCVVEAAVGDAFGRRVTGRFRLGAEWTEYQLTLDLQPAPRGPAEARAAGVEWDRRRVTPGDEEPRPRIEFWLGPVPGEGPPTDAVIDDVRLVRGTVARPAPPPELAVDLLWDPAGPDRPVWLGRPGAVDIRARGPAGLAGRFELRGADGRPRHTWELAPRPTNHWRLPLTEIGAGCWEAVATVTAEGRTAVRRRLLTVLHDRTFVASDSPFTLGLEALSRLRDGRALGCRRVRWPVDWARLAEPTGEPRWELLDKVVGWVAAWELELVLAVGLAPDWALPARVVTTRRMDSHGYQKGVPLADVEAFERWATAVAKRYRDRPVVYELQSEAYRYFHAEAYVDYLTRFAAALRRGAPEARVVGLGHAFEAGPKLTPFYEEVARRRGEGLVERTTLHLPGPLGEAPESWLGSGLARLADARLSAVPAALPAVQIEPPGSLLVAPGTERPRFVAPDQVAAEISPWRLAAQTLRTWLAVVRLRPAGFNFGWAGGFGPREAALDWWLTHAAEAVFLRDFDLGDQVHGMLFELAGGLGLAAVWDAGDPRSRRSELADEVAALRLPTVDGPLTVVDLYGQPLDSSVREGVWTVPLSFEPVYLRTLAPAALARWLAEAEVRGRQRVRLAPTLAIIEERPALVVHGEVIGERPARGEIQLSLSPGGRLAVDRLPYDFTGERGEVVAPLAGWLGDRLTARLVATAGNRVVDRRRELLRWPWPAAAPPLIDGEADDWPADAARYEPGAASWRQPPDADWLGPDDASARLLAQAGDGWLAVWAEVRDNDLRGGDRLELFWDLDVAGDPLDDAFSGDDYRLELTPLADGQFRGGHRVSRGPGGGPELLAVGQIRSAFRRTANGYRVEVLLPLTAAGRDLLLAARCLGFEVRLRDEDAARTVTLSLFGRGPEPSPGEFAQVWLARGECSPAEPAVPLEFPLTRVLFAAGDLTAPYRLTPDRSAGAVIRTVAKVDFPRRERALRIELGEAREIGVLTFTPPDGARASVWARRLSGVGRLFLDQAGQRHEVRLEAGWRRTFVALATGEVTVTLEGPAVVELVEIVVEP